MLFGIRHKLNKKHLKFGDKVSATIVALYPGSLLTDLLTAMATKRVMSKLGLVLNKKFFEKCFSQNFSVNLIKIIFFDLF